MKLIMNWCFGLVKLLMSWNSSLVKLVKTWYYCLVMPVLSWGITLVKPVMSWWTSNGEAGYALVDQPGDADYELVLLHGETGYGAGTRPWWSWLWIGGPACWILLWENVPGKLFGFSCTIRSMAQLTKNIFIVLQHDHIRFHSYQIRTGMWGYSGDWLSCSGHCLVFCFSAFYSQPYAQMCNSLYMCSILFIYFF